MCKTICDPASCCFYDDGSCMRDIDCEYYSFCAKFITSEKPAPEDLGPQIQPSDEDIEEILPPSGGQHSAGPSTTAIFAACGDLTSENVPEVSTCSILCDNYTCCFREDYKPASCHEQSTCDKYKPCQKILKDTSKDDGDEGDEGDTSPKVCSVDDLVTMGGYPRCEAHCSDHMCCFSDADCNEYSQCSEYAECKMLRDNIVKGTDIHGATTFDYQKACSKDAIYGRNDRESCELICEPVRLIELDLEFRFIFHLFFTQM